ncbi:myogenesis-regulating glycosidase-like isoform X2 [Planococcus citri]|uniref:myogenesis-regulating glycosidase-like isoform X2 n=1 Tax=Planococcus citri TaxID=170843 RepID=UPI0031F77D3E
MLKLVSFSTLLFCIFLTTQGDASFQERLRLESNKIFIKYRHEIKGQYTGFHQTVDISRLSDIQPSDCSTNAFTFCLKWDDVAQFKLVQRDHCEEYEYTTKQDKPLKVTFDISNVHLYGGVEQDFQKWPIDFDEYDEYPYVSTDVFTKGVLEPYWLTSTGMYLYVDEKTPLFVTLKKSKGIFELTAKRKPPYIRNNPETVLKYTVCKFKNAKDAQKHAIAHIFGKPTGIPDETMVQYPIWSTWAKYKSEINHTTVMEFANLIKKNNFPNSQLEIDDRWDVCYGSMEVDKTRFPDMKGLVKKLNKHGFRVTFWVHPFINEDCEPFHSQAKQAGYFVKNHAGETRVTWWNGNASVIDFTNPQAVDWWYKKLKKVQTETEINSFKFDAMESNYNPQVPIYHRLDDSHPETNLKEYMNFVSRFGNMVEVRAAKGAQKNPSFVRMMDRDTNWDGRLGLTTMIPTLLQMNIIGYPYVIPDMIGGNGYDADVVTKEMFVRWLQINALMPALQFSFPPWDYGDEVIQLTHKFIDLHFKYSDKIIEAMKHAKETGTPVNPPIWWIDPTDPIAQNIGSEFLLGENILVAPVLEPGVRSRDIYLPRGVWRDEVNTDSEPIRGPIWLYNYPADLDVLPYFTKIKDIDDGKSNANVSILSINLLICSITLLFIRNLFFR